MMKQNNQKQQQKQQKRKTIERERKKITYPICRFDADITNYDIVEEYLVNASHVHGGGGGGSGSTANNKTLSNRGNAHVYITSDGQYIIREPPLSLNARRAYDRLMTNIHHSFTYDNIIERDNIMNLLRRTLETESKGTSDFDVWKMEKESIEYYMMRNILGLAELDVFMKDPNIEDILCIYWNRPVAIVHKNHPQHTLLRTNVQFQCESDMEQLIQRVSQRYGEPPNDTRPMTSFSGEYGERYTFTGNRKITPDSPTISIRKPSTSHITIYHLLSSGILSTLAAAYLWCIMDLRGFGLIIGAPSAGKTTMINAIFTMSNPNWHYYTIEDVLELRLPHQYVSRHQTTINSSLNAGNTNMVNFDVFDLCKLSLRFRPDFVVVGEILGKEADGLFQAAASGSGCMCSFHATNAEHAITRLEAEPISLSKSQTSLLTYILHMSWILHDGKRQRKLTAITENNKKYDDTGNIIKDENQLTDIFYYDNASNQLLPDDIDTVIAKSQKLSQDMKLMLGITDVKSNLTDRMNTLQYIIDHNITDIDKIHDTIHQYYMNISKK